MLIEDALNAGVACTILTHDMPALGNVKKDMETLRRMFEELKAINADASCWLGKGVLKQAVERKLRDLECEKPSVETVARAKEIITACKESARKEGRAKPTRVRKAKYLMILSACITLNLTGCVYHGGMQVIDYLANHEVTVTMPDVNITDYMKSRMMEKCIHHTEWCSKKSAMHNGALSADSCPPEALEASMQCFMENLPSFVRENRVVEVVFGDLGNL